MPDQHAVGSERPPLTDEQKEAMEAAFKEVAPIMRAERFEAGFRAGLASSQRAGEGEACDLAAIRAVLAAYRSTGAHITEAQITDAWAAFDRLSRQGRTDAVEHWATAERENAWDPTGMAHRRAESAHRAGEPPTPERVTVADLVEGDTIVVQAIPMQAERVIRIEDIAGVFGDSPLRVLHLQGGGERHCRPDNPVLCARAALDAARHAPREEEPVPCYRPLIGMGGDSWDPLCARPKGHAGLCRADPDEVDAARQPDTGERA